MAALAVGAAMSMTSSTAEASGFLGARFGSDHGNPVGANPFAIYFNPAAMGGAKGSQLSIDAAVIYRLATYERGEDALSSTSVKPGSSIYEDYKKSNTGTGKVSNILALPFAGFITDFGGSPVHAGVGVYIPFGGLANWNRFDDFKSSPSPGAVDGPQRWFNISGKIISLYNTAALSYTIPGTGLSIGANGSLVLHQVETVRARNANGSDESVGPNGRIIEGRTLVAVSGANFAGALGLYYEAIPKKLTFGASYSARPGFGQMRLKGELKSQFGQAVADEVNDIELLQTMPDVWRIGFGYRATEKIEVRADFEYVTWSNFKRQCLVSAKDGPNPCNLYENGAEANPKNVVIQNVERNWIDGFGLRASLGYHLTPEVTEVFGSAGFDTSAVPDKSLDPTIIDSFKLLGTIGVRHHIVPKFALSTSYNIVYFLERDTTGKSEFFKLEADSKQPSASGKYNQQFHFINVNGTYTF